MRPIILALCLALPACVQPRIVYERPDTTETQVAQDERECRFEAARATAGMSGGNPFTVAADRYDADRRVFITCMLARRYERRVYRD